MRGLTCACTCDLQVVVLRGLNLPINAKVPDFEPLKDPTHLSRLQTLPLYGTSIARVLFTWEAFEPERGVYNLDYLNYYLKLVQVCTYHYGHYKLACVCFNQP